MQEEERLKKQMEFALEADKLKFIGRQTYLSDGSRKENDAEHSWHLALLAILLAEHSNEKLDVLKVVTMVLIHDLVEIDAGDTYAYDSEGNKTKRAREVACANRIFNLLPMDQAKYMYDLWEEFEAYETIEARFAHTLDNCQPLMLNDATGGRSWREHEVELKNVLKRNERTHEGSEAIWKIMSDIIDKNVSNKNIKE